MERYVRKDALPSETIERILSILNNCGIEIKVVNETNYETFWYSVRVCFRAETLIFTLRCLCLILLNLILVGIT